MRKTEDSRRTKAATTGRAPESTVRARRFGPRGAKSLAKLELPGLTRVLWRLVDLVASVKASLYAKLLAGFLTLTLLLLSMGMLNSVVINRMRARVGEIERLQAKMDGTRRMEYLITAQSHYRAMALQTGKDSYNRDVAVAKRSFLEQLDKVEALSGPGHQDFFENVRLTNRRFDLLSENVLGLYNAGQIDAARDLHLDQEHPVSHGLEQAMRQLQADALAEMQTARNAFDSDRRLLMTTAIGFSTISIAAALLLGFVLSWSLIRPVRRIDMALAAIAAGDFTRRVDVPNRDEFGTLATNLNATSAKLATLYRDLSNTSEHLQAVVDNAMDAIITLDEHGIIRSYNPAARAMFGYSDAEAIGQRVTLLMPDAGQGSIDTLPTDQPAWNSGCLNGGCGEVVGRHKDGHSFLMDLSFSEMRLREQRMFIGIARDITDSKRVQAELALTRDQALEASRAKSAFLANMSHELRTPLNAIIGYSEMLQEEADEAGQQLCVPDLKKISDAGKQLLALINDILDLSKVEAGKMALYLETFDIAHLVQDVVDTIRPLVAQNANRLDVRLADDLGSMRADATKTRQVLLNLLSNAAKFTASGQITLEVARAQDEQDWIVFRVRDTGIGMAPEQLGRLFQAFSQADTSITHKFGGTGLGLAITRHFCEMMGGEITVASELGQGSTFSVRLPVTVGGPEARTAQAHETRATPAGGAAIVLIIDDDPAPRDLLQRFLSKEGFVVETAADGEAGLRLAKELRPIAIILDVIMPNLDGWSVLSALKADPDVAGIPVVMLTIVDDKNMGFALGAADYMTKPMDQQRLLTVLEKYRRDGKGAPAGGIEAGPDSQEVLRRLIEENVWA